MINKNLVNLDSAELIVEARRVVEKCEKEESLGGAYTTVSMEDMQQIEKQLRKVLFSMSGREVHYRIRQLLEYYAKLQQSELRTGVGICV